MIWPVDTTLQTVRCSLRREALRRVHAAIVTLAIGLTAALPAAADVADGGEKLIGTFEIRAGADRTSAGDGRSNERLAPGAVTPAAASRESGRFGSVSLRRNFLTGEAAVPQTIEAIFSREAGDRVFFGSGSAEIGTRARTVITSQAEWLKRNPQLRITIEGHADDGGTNEQNIKVALERADALRERLIEEGVEPRRIAVVSRGREERIAACGDPSCMAQNRRAIVVVHAIGAGERVGFERVGNGRGPTPGRPGEADASRMAPAPR